MPRRPDAPFALPVVVLLVAFLIALCLFAAPVEGSAAEAAPGGHADKAEQGGSAKGEAQSALPEETRSVTHHVVDTPAGKLRYTATACFLNVDLPGQKAKARIFSVSYVLDGARPADRPVTFAFNGGPGSSSVWLHLGVLGPRRVVLPGDGSAPPPPARLADNPETWLAFTDLVFVDPVGTGFSRGIPDDAAAERKFWGVKQDLSSMGEFVRLWLSRNNRWLSPKFLAGESYGTLRAAALSAHLYEAYGAELSGLVLLSPILDYATVLRTEGNDLPYVVALPTYAATAWKHGRLSARLQALPLPQLLAEVESFCTHDFLRVLYEGEEAPAAERDAVFKREAEYTGLPEELVSRLHGRVGPGRFCKELLRDKGLVLGRMDTTVTGPDPDPASPWPTYDPSLDSLSGPFAGAVNAYLREELKFSSDMIYEPLSGKVNSAWDFQSGLDDGQGFVDVSRALRRALVLNPHLKVFWAMGRYDLATPYFAARHTIGHLFLPGGLGRNLTTDYYDGGHMMYTHAAARAALLSDARGFYRQAAGQAAGGAK
ncbi:peptidase S10 serine carboxypeptidase [Desulfovibrio sp. X2]|uniref:S10 family peptidase n=1 Tax=Desulfovibrio sp. X2 TaxID=941449 RepID=UPI00035889ED|nr:peptidase S10 serine carboxypeptidase [Desulfovibrio sp. X2]EPR37548.1 peptidase S10 serine carboxypeptidase [Desulfovibrio sp. X2]